MCIVKFGVKLRSLLRRFGIGNLCGKWLPLEAIHSPLKLILSDIRTGKYKDLIPKQTWAFLKVLVYLERRFYGI